ncbi:MAG: response regulator transcription factor [Acidobacteria bacterium]|nr:response regulator transcription factor [Acidobacteriota bacterium]
MSDILVASDSDHVINELDAALGDTGTTVRSVRRGADVRPTVEAKAPDLVILDLQIGNMGGMAACLDLRLEAGAGRIDDVPVLMLLDRRADVFLAHRSGADGFLVKPLDALRIRRAATAILDGGEYHDPTGAPPTGIAAGVG